jgi:hypothetical protein
MVEACTQDCRSKTEWQVSAGEQIDLAGRETRGEAAESDEWCRR